jgi:hypothetical protein
MFKPITSIILIFVLAAQTFKGEVMVVNYYTNTAAFAKNCINEARPKLHCNGKCQLMKRLQEEEKKNEQVPERTIENEVTICLKSFFVEGPLLPIKFVSEQGAFYRPKGKYTNHNVDIFHPPKFSSL